MNTKKFALISALIGTLIITTSAFAIESSNTLTTTSSDQAASGDTAKEGLSVRDRLEAAKKAALGKRETKKEDAVSRVRNSIGVHVKVLDRAVGLAGRILDKLQLRIDRAKDAGKDTTSLTALMTDARSKLADATTRLGNITSKKDQAVDKATFRSMELELKTVRKDIQGARQDAAKIISGLKGFNSATSSAKKSETSATTSAEKE